MVNSFDIQAEEIAREIHKTYERYAPDHIEGRPSRVLWERLPEENKSLMVAVVRKLLIDDIITPGSAVENRTEQIPISS